MLINSTNLLILKYQLVVQFLKIKYKELKRQLFSYSNALFCYVSLTLYRQMILKLLYYIHTIEYSSVRKDLHFQSDIPSLTLPN